MYFDYFNDKEYGEYKTKLKAIGKLKHKSLIKFIKYFENEDYFSLVFQYHANNL